MRVAVIGYDAREFRGAIARASDVKRVSLPVDWAREATLGKHRFLLAANGAGMNRAAAATDAAAAWHPESVVSFGFCGAVDPSLRIGEIVVATSVAGPDGAYPALPVACGRAFQPGVVRTLDHIAGSAAEKIKWLASGARVVEMEAAGVAERSRALGLPFHCIKAVSDLAGETLANNFDRYLREDGHLDRIGLLADCFRRPLTRVPELARLMRRSGQASCSLGDFLADCRF